MQLHEGLVLLGPDEGFPAGIEYTQGHEHTPGLMAVGGQLSTASLRAAYARGLFPWFCEGEPIMWWCTSPRMVLKTDHFKVHRSMLQDIKRRFASKQLRVSVNQTFDSVIRACSAASRAGQSGTWISPQIIAAYEDLHRAGTAHSVEVWNNDDLVGGLYGLNLGRMFYGESMFSTQSGSSKIALAALVAMCRQRDVPWIDCQQETDYLALMGAQPVDKASFLHHLGVATTQSQPSEWSYDEDRLMHDFIA